MRATSWPKQCYETLDDASDDTDDGVGDEFEILGDDERDDVGDL